MNFSAENRFQKRNREKTKRKLKEAANAGSEAAKKKLQELKDEENNTSTSSKQNISPSLQDMNTHERQELQDAIDKYEKSPPEANDKEPRARKKPPSNREVLVQTVQTMNKDKQEEALMVLEAEGIDIRDRLKGPYETEDEAINRHSDPGINNT